jgi:hypothetical protein
MVLAPPYGVPACAGWSVLRVGERARSSSPPPSPVRTPACGSSCRPTRAPCHQGDPLRLRDRGPFSSQKDEGPRTGPELGARCTRHPLVLAEQDFDAPIRHLWSRPPKRRQRGVQKRFRRPGSAHRGRSPPDHGASPRSEAPSRPDASRTRTELVTPAPQAPGRRPPLPLPTANPLVGGVLGQDSTRHPTSQLHSRTTASDPAR